MVDLRSPSRKTVQMATINEVSMTVEEPSNDWFKNFWNKKQRQIDVVRNGQEMLAA
jgi:hypothetical protein